MPVRRRSTGVRKSSGSTSSSSSTIAMKEIAAAQHKAHEIGVDVLLFVATHSVHKSTRWTDQNLASLTRLYPFVRTNATPIHAVTERRVRVVAPMTGRSRRLD